MSVCLLASAFFMKDDHAAGLPGKAKTSPEPPPKEPVKVEPDSGFDEKTKDSLPVKEEIAPAEQERQRLANEDAEAAKKQETETMKPEELKKSDQPKAPEVPLSVPPQKVEEEK